MPLTLNRTRKRIDIDFEWVSIVCGARKIHFLTSEFHVKFHLTKTDISVFLVKFNVEFTVQAVNFFIVAVKRLECVF